MKQIYLPSVGSTNAWMQENLMHQTWDEGTLVYTDYQTNGRGQLTNTWESEVGKNILMSMYFAPLWLPIRDQFVLSQAVALGVVDFLRHLIAKHLVERTLGHTERGCHVVHPDRLDAQSHHHSRYVFLNFLLLCHNFSKIIRPQIYAKKTEKQKKFSSFAVFEQ